MNKGKSSAAVVVAVVLVGCSHKPAPLPPQASAPPPPVVTMSCAKQGTGPSPTLVSTPRASGAVVLAKLDGKTLAYVADEDERAILVVDVDTGKQTARLDVDGRPSQLLFLPDGRLAVGLRDRATVAILETTSAVGSLAQRCAVPTAAEPVALALTPDDGTLLVSSAWGRTLTAYEGAALTRKFEVPLAREPRAIVTSDDGKTAFVTHAVGGQISAVSLEEGHRIELIALHGVDPQDPVAEPKGPLASAKAAFKRARSSMQHQMATTRASCQGFALVKTTEPGGRLLAPQVLVDPGDPRHRPSGYGSDNDQTEAPNVAVVDMATRAPLDVSLEKQNGMMMRAMRGDRDDHHHEECLLPRAAAYDPASRTVLVTCLGIDALVAYDAAAVSPVRAERRRWDVAAGPTGVAVDSIGRRAVVWSQFDRTLSRVGLAAADMADDAPKPDRFALAGEPSRKLPVEVALGRLLFHEVGDARMSHDGRACASCHPDGRDDGLTWSTPEGPRRSIMLAGRVATTAPYSWSGSESSLEEHLDITFERLHGAGGLKSIELGALAGYVATLAPPAFAVKTDPKIDRGRAIFASAEAACVSCHTGEATTDNKHHDVQSKGVLDKNGMFNTPSLRFVGGAGPYFHDGRFATLHDLLLTMDGKMGNVKQLNDEDLGALEAYLGSL